MNQGEMIAAAERLPELEAEVARLQKLASDFRDEADNLRAAVQAFFDAPIPPGKYTTTGGAVFVSLAGMVKLQEALGVPPAKAL